MLQALIKTYHPTDFGVSPKPVCNDQSAGDDRLSPCAISFVRRYTSSWEAAIVSGLNLETKALGVSVAAFMRRPEMIL
jgi:hypothetical protein